MYLSITFIELKRPMQFFELSLNGMRIVKQLRKTPGARSKNTGFWTKHYTMSLWNSEQELKAFAKSGAHLEAMKKSAKLAKQIKTLTIQHDRFLPWKEAKEKVQLQGKTLWFT